MKPPIATPSSPSTEKKPGINVVIVEDQQLLADFFGAHCEDLGLKVRCRCGTCREGLAAIREHRPDLVLLDLSLPDGDGLELVRLLKTELKSAAPKILAISCHRDPWTMLQVQRLGLNGFVDKNEQCAEVLTNAIRTVLAGGAFYTPIVQKLSAAIRHDSKAFIRVLSEYEIQILSLIGGSMSDDEIGVVMGVRPTTIQARRRDIMIKLGIYAVPKLIRYAIANGLTRVDHLGFQKTM